MAESVGVKKEPQKQVQKTSGTPVPSGKPPAGAKPPQPAGNVTAPVVVRAANRRLGPSLCVFTAICLIAMEAAVGGVFPASLPLKYLCPGLGLLLAAGLSFLFMWGKRKAWAERNALVSSALRSLCAGRPTEMPAADPLGAVFQNAGRVLESNLKARLFSDEARLKKAAEQEIAKIRSQCEGLIQKGAEKLAQDAKAALGSCESLKAELEKEKNERGAERQAAEARIDAAKKEAQQLNAQVKELEAKLSAEEQDARRLSEEMERLRGETSERTAQRESLSQEAKDLRGKLEAAEEAHRRVSTDMESLRKAAADSEGLAKGKAELEAQLAARGAECQKLSAEILRQVEEISNLRKHGLKFFDKVAAQLQGPLQIIEKQAGEVARECAERKARAGNERTVDASLFPWHIAETNSLEIEKRSTQLYRLVEQILDLCRLEASAITLVYSEMNLKRTVQKGFDEVQAVATEKSIVLSTKIKEDFLAVRTDARIVARVLRKLLHNAVHFTPKGGRVVVGAEFSATGPQGPAPQGSQWLRIDVTDTGPGVAPEDRKRIFDAFEKGTDPQFTVSDATPGLGLTLSKKYAALLGGDILLESEVGRGSRFSLVIPVKVCETARL